MDILDGLLQRLAGASFSLNFHLFFIRFLQALYKLIFSRLFVFLLFFDIPGDLSFFGPLRLLPVSFFRLNGFASLRTFIGCRLFSFQGGSGVFGASGVPGSPGPDLPAGLPSPGGEKGLSVTR